MNDNVIVLTKLNGYILFKYIEKGKSEYPMYFREKLTNWELNVKFFHHFNFLSVIEMHLNFIIAFGNHSTLLSVVEEIKNKTKSRVMEVGEGIFYF